LKPERLIKTLLSAADLFKTALSRKLFSKPNLQVAARVVAGHLVTLHSVTYYKLWPVESRHRSLLRIHIAQQFGPSFFVFPACDFTGGMRK
jgi:hypothetical protein